MKKILLGFVVCILASSFVLSQGPSGIHEPGTGIENPEIKVAGQEQRAIIQAGNYVNQMGRQMKIHQQANNRCMLEVGGVSADCPFNLTQEMWQNRTKLYAELSNGRNAEIKIMPDTASQTALQRLRLRNCSENCTIELKEVGLGNQTRMAYEMKTQRNSKVFGLFGARMNVQAQVDAETGELIQVRKPWWAFLASEPEE